MVEQQPFKLLVPSSSLGRLTTINQIELATHL